MKILICTVGTSLLTHWRDIVKNYTAEEGIRLVKELKKLPDGDRKQGAELCSIFSLLKDGKIAVGDKIYLCVSDTPEGLFTGEVVDGFFTSTFDVEVKKITGLQGENPKKFQSGLRMLVDTIAKIMSQHRNMEIAINATGGFKAQISFAGLIGQAFSIPVYYQFETFPTCIGLPPLPVSWDFDLWLKHYDLIEDVEQGVSGEVLPAADARYCALPQEMKVLFDEEDGEVVLSALGALFHEGFKERFLPHMGQLLPAESGISPDQKKIVYEDKNEGKHGGLKEFLGRIKKVEYVTRINTFYTFYYNPDLPERIRFRSSNRGDDRVEGWYSDGQATTKFDVYLTRGTQLRQRQAAVADLNRRIIGG